MSTNTNLYERLTQLQWLLKKQRHQTRNVSGPMADTTRGQGRILAFLKMKDGVSTKDLSYLLGIRISSLNELLLKLEKSDYIYRKPSEEDKRIILIYLSDKGKEIDEPKQEIDSIFNCLSEDEQITFSEYLDRIIISLEEKLGKDNTENDNLYNWMESTRKRMGSKKFKELIGARERMGPMPKNFCRQKGKFSDFDCDQTRNGKGQGFHHGSGKGKGQNQGGKGQGFHHGSGKGKGQNLSGNSQCFHYGSGKGKGQNLGGKGQGFHHGIGKGKNQNLSGNSQGFDHGSGKGKGQNLGGKGQGFHHGSGKGKNQNLSGNSQGFHHGSGKGKNQNQSGKGQGFQHGSGRGKKNR